MKVLFAIAFALLFILFVMPQQSQANGIQPIRSIPRANVVNVQVVNARVGIRNPRVVIRRNGNVAIRR